MWLDLCELLLGFERLPSREFSVLRVKSNGCGRASKSQVAATDQEDNLADILRTRLFAPTARRALRDRPSRRLTELPLVRLGQIHERYRRAFSKAKESRGVMQR